MNNAAGLNSQLSSRPWNEPWWPCAGLLRGKWLLLASSEADVSAVRSSKDLPGMASFEHEAARHEARRRSHWDAAPRVPTGAIVILRPLCVPAFSSLVLCTTFREASFTVNEAARGRDAIILYNSRTAPTCVVIFAAQI